MTPFTSVLSLQSPQNRVKRVWHLGTFLLASAILSAGCNYSRDKKKASEKEPKDSAELASSSYQKLNDELFKPFCLSCHNGSQKSGGVNLESYDALLQSRSIRSGTPILVAKKPQDSSVFTTIVSGKMPPGPRKPSPGLVSDLAQWIVNGAKQNAPADLTPTPTAPSQPNPPPPGEPGRVEPTPAPLPAEPPRPSPTPPVTPAAPDPAPVANVPEEPATTPPIPGVSFADIQTKLLDEHCVFCHSAEDASGNVLLDSYEAVINGKNNDGLPVVTAKDPGKSLIYTSIVRDDNFMPPGDEHLPTDLSDLLKTWIEQGAPK